MPYIPAYTGVDLAPITTDAVGKGLVAVGTLAPIIAGVAAYKYLKTPKKKRKSPTPKWLKK